MSAPVAQLDRVPASEAGSVSSSLAGGAIFIAMLRDCPIKLCLGVSFIRHSIDVTGTLPKRIPSADLLHMNTNDQSNIRIVQRNTTGTDSVVLHDEFCDVSTSFGGTGQKRLYGGPESTDEGCAR